MSRRASGPKSPGTLAWAVSLSRRGTQQRWRGTAAEKFSSMFWLVTHKMGVTRATIWRTWNLPRPPTLSRSSGNAIDFSWVPLYNCYFERLAQDHRVSLMRLLSPWLCPHPFPQVHVREALSLRQSQPRRSSICLLAVTRGGSPWVLEPSAVIQRPQGPLRDTADPGSRKKKLGSKKGEERSHFD